MRVIDFLAPDCIIAALQARTKPAVLSELCIANVFRPFPAVAFFAAMIVPFMKRVVPAVDRRIA